MTTQGPHQLQPVTVERVPSIESQLAAMGMLVHYGKASGLTFGMAARTVEWTDREWEIYMNALDQRTLTLSPRRRLVRTNPRDSWFVVIEG